MCRINKIHPTEQVTDIKTKFYRHKKQRKQIKARWLTSLYFSYFNRDFSLSSSRMKFTTQVLCHVHTSTRVSLVGMVTIYLSSIKGNPFFNLSLILSIFFNMDFTQTQVQSYRKPLPEKSKILKQSCFYAISYLFCSQHLCKYNLTAQKK